METTYKMAWIRSIVEICSLDPAAKTLHFHEISRKVFAHYWNQTIFFNLNQGPNPRKKPEIFQLVFNEITKYQSKYGHQPKYFSRVEDLLTVPVEEISKTLGRDVCWRFPKVDEITYPLYDLDQKNQSITIHRPDLIKECSDILFDQINYRWAQKLEEFNHAPRISQKVKGTDREDIKRTGNLGTTFKKYLTLENPDHICFYTGKKLSEENKSIDHVLPWSYLFSDDLWNLVYVDKAYNSKKGNRIPEEKEIKRLEKRNLRLLDLLRDSNLFRTKHTQELRLSIERNLLHKFWIGCKG